MSALDPERARLLLLRAQGHLERAADLITSAGRLLPDAQHQSTCESNKGRVTDVIYGLGLLRAELAPKRGGK